MPYRDEAGVKHVLATDPISDGARLHLLSCELCKSNFPNNARLIRYEDDMAHLTEDGSVENGNAARGTYYEEKPRYIEDDLKVLAELDNKIAELISQRHERMDTIKAQQDQNLRRVQSHDDWFEGTVRCNPVPDRGSEVEYINRDHRR